MITEFQNYFIELLEQSDIPAHSINHEGFLIYVSKGWLKLLGYERYEVIGKKTVDFLTTDSKKKAKFVLIEFYKKGILENIEYTFIKKSGELISVLLNAKSVKEGDKFIRSTTVLTPINLLQNKINSRVNNWVNNQTLDIRVLLKNLNVNVLDNGDVVIECPNVHWFSIITALKKKFRYVNSLELSAPATGDFRIIEMSELTPHILEPTLKPNLFHVG